MKTGKFLFPVILALAAAFINGCETTPAVDWNSRVGHYTYDQAVQELGPPDKQTGLTTGGTVAEWIEHRPGGTSVGIGTGFFGPGMGIGVGETIGSGYRDRILKLTFDATNVLVSWSKNY
jgi:hypothetical protein